MMNSKQGADGPAKKHPNSASNAINNRQPKIIGAYVSV
jgi:hypothetical protein